MIRISPVVVCVVVTYGPERSRFQQLLQAVTPQVARVIMVDNGSPRACLQWLRELPGPDLTLIELDTNKGIAAAQNIGIAAAQRLACTHLLLLDHDSVPATTMVADLLHAIEVLGPRAHQVAAVGPRYLDLRQNNPPPFIRVSGLRLVRCKCVSPKSIVEVDYLIASGSLIPITTLQTVGGMAEELFIDYVDIEWGLRARRHGFQSYGVCGAAMSHDLGEAPATFMGRSVPLHSPLRHYYHFRNAVWLYRSATIPLQWKVVDGWRLLLKYGFYTLFTTPRMAHLKMMTRGILDGLRGRLGRLETGGATPAPGR